jgi:tetratricopeptide (TPR) repeat protein
MSVFEASSSSSSSSLSPPATPASFRMGCLFRKAGRHRAAVKLFRDAIDEGMEEAKCHFNLASSLSALGGDTEEAIRHFERAAELDDSLHDAKTNLAAILIRTGKLEEAVALCDAVLVG